MKVTEKGAERTAEAHIYVEGRVKALEEYGQYVDSHDKAICCYIPVEEGHAIRVESRFSGTTFAIVQDVLVDGVCRKTNSIFGKSVQVQKRKVSFETFLYQMPFGVIDTAMSVANHYGPSHLDKEAEETVGTIELRVYVARQFGVEHDIRDVCKYDKVQEGADSSTRVETYKDLPPQFHMTFEKNCSALDGRKANGEKKKVYAKRPGTEPWAIFRFHYRSKEAIIDLNMEMTFDPTDKTYAKKEAHPLDLEPVPLLLLGSKPAGKNDGEDSMRTSSSPPPDTLSAPVKGSRKSQFIQPKVVIKKQSSKHTPSDSKSTSDSTSVDQTQTAAVNKPIAPDLTLGDLQLVYLNSKDGPSVNATTESSLTKIDDSAPAAVKEEDGNADTDAPKTSTESIGKKALEPINEDADRKSEISMKALDEVTSKSNTDLAGLVLPPLPVQVSNTPTVPHPADLPSVFEPTTASSATVVPAAVLSHTKDFIKSGSKGFTSPLKKATSKPAPINTTTSTLLQKPVVAPTPATPVKRAPESTLTPPPDLKRLKSDAVSPFTPTYVARAVSATPSPRALSLEARVAEQRQILQATRKKRAEIAKKKAVLDERMSPYKQRMAEELERLKEEMAYEEAMMAEDEEEIKATEAMIAEFERTDGHA